jgi:NAD-dependent DNA ligase
MSKKNQQQDAQARWRKVISSASWGDVRVVCGKRAFAVRANQQAELQSWLSGSWDSDWLVVADGCPAGFVSQDGAMNTLTLAPPKTGKGGLKRKATMDLPPPAAKKSAAVGATKTAVFSGLEFCISGTLSVSKKAMTSKLEGVGAKVATGVTKATTYLLTTPADRASRSNKASGSAELRFIRKRIG